MPALISVANLLERAGVSLVTTNDATGLGGRNLLTGTLAEVWRTVGASAEVQVDLGSPQAAQAVVLCAPRDGLLPAAGSTVRITASNLSQIGAELFDSGASSGGLTADGTWTADSTATVDAGSGTSTRPLSLPVGYQCWILPKPGVTARYWRVVLTGAAGQPYLQFGRLWLAAGLLTANDIFADGYGLEAADEPGRTPIRRTSFTLGTLSGAERVLLEAIGLSAGTQQQALVIPRTLDADRTAIIGRFTAIPAPRAFQGFLGGQLYTGSMTIQEDR